MPRISRGYIEHPDCGSHSLRTIASRRCWTPTWIVVRGAHHNPTSPFQGEEVLGAFRREYEHRHETYGKETLLVQC